MYAIDRRKVASQMYTMLQSQRKVATLLGVSHSTISRWLNNPDRKPYPKRYSKSGVIVQTVKNLIDTNPFLPIRELQKKIHECFQFQVSKTLLYTVLHNAKYSYKKSKRFSQPVHLEQKRLEFLHLRKYYQEKGYTFLCMDGTSFGRNTKERYGYARKGEKLYVQNLQPRTTTMTEIVRTL